MALPLGSTPSIIVGAAVGGAAAAALAPAIELPRQSAWERNPNRMLDPALLARLVAQGGIDLATAAADAKRDGFSPDKMDALVYLAQTTPPVDEALTLWRRGLISDQLYTHVLVKAGIDARYYPSLADLKTSEPLDPAVIATAIQRGIMHDPGFLPVGPPTGEGNVPAFPVSSLDALGEAAQSGIERERLFVQTAIVGLPLALVQAAQGFFRGILTENDFKRAVSEGNTRNEWADAALEVSRQILTAGEYAELQLRGFLNREQRLALTARHGMTDADSDRLYDVLGRAPNIHAVTTGLARGGHYTGEAIDIPEPFKSSVQRGNIRPEWYGLEFANRYSYPSAFVLRALMQAGIFTEQEAETLLLEIGWRPDLAAKVATFYTQGTAAVADKHVGKAETQLWTTAHKSYVNGESDQGEATVALNDLAIPADAQAAIFRLWDAERELIRKQLTPANIKKLWKEAKWTRDEAIQRLVTMGYSSSDANDFLDL